MFHPDAYPNERFRGNTFQTICGYLDQVCTQLLIFCSGNEDIRCTAGSDMFNNVKDREACKLMKGAGRQALLRAQHVVMEAWRACDAGNMTDKQKSIVERILDGAATATRAEAWRARVMLGT